jgi:2-alkyl-3-oxoalkanoate reductase
LTATLVTGASGFVGGHIARALAGRGDRVRGLVRDPARAGGLDGIELATGDVTDAASIERAVAGVDRVFHCAALVGDWLDKDDIRRVNVDGTANVLDACAAAGVGRLVYISSLAVLGTKHHHGTDESAPYAETGDVYSDAKIESERLVRSFADEGRVETVVLRPGFVYGPGDRQFLPRLLDSLATRRFVYVGDGSKLLNIVYIDDLARAALLAADTELAAGEAFNLTDGTETSLREFVTSICEQTGLPAPTRRLRPSVAWALTYTLEAVAKARRAKEAPRLNRARMKFLYYNQHFSIEKARRDLGFEPRFTYREGLPPTLESFRLASGRPGAAGAPAASAPRSSA